MSHSSLSSKMMKKPSLWFFLVCFLLVSSVILYNHWVANAASTPPSAHKGSASAISSHPNTAPNVSAPVASQGAALNLSVDSTQDMALAGEQNLSLDAALNSPVDQGGVIRLRKGFASISLETSHICNYVTDVTQAKLATLLKNFGSGGIIRVGGESV